MTASQRGSLITRPDVPAALVALATAALYTAFSLHQWANFAAPSWDLGIFTQLAQQYSRFAAPIVDIKAPGYNLWGDHFHPVLVLLGPIFRLFPSALTLLIVQNLLFAISAYPITRLARRRLGGPTGTMLGVAYALSWGLASTVESQFHEVAFAVPMLAFGLVAWLEGRLLASAIWMGALVFVKEDLGLTVAAFGAIILWVGRREVRDRRVGVSLVLWGLIWFALTIWVILPHFSEQGTWEYSDRLSGGAWSLLGGLFLPEQKLLTLGLLVVACGVVGLRSPIVLLMLPTLAWRFAGNVEHYWDWHWHYSAVLMPIAVVALIDGLGRIQPGRMWRLIAPLAVAISLAGSLGMAYSGPLGLLVRAELPALTAQEREAAEGMIEAIGTDRMVVTDLMVLARLVPGNTVFWEGTVQNADVDTVALTPQTQVLQPGEAADIWAQERFGGSWALVYDAAGFQVAKRQG